MSHQCCVTSQRRTCWLPDLTLTFCCVHEKSRPIYLLHVRQNHAFSHLWLHILPKSRLFPVFVACSPKSRVFPPHTLSQKMQFSRLFSQKSLKSLNDFRKKCNSRDFFRRCLKNSFMIFAIFATSSQKSQKILIGLAKNCNFRDFLSLPPPPPCIWAIYGPYIGHI